MEGIIAKIVLGIITGISKPLAWIKFFLVGMNLKFKKNAYHKRIGSGVYCPICWDSRKKLIRLLSVDDRQNYKCGECKNIIAENPKLDCEKRKYC